LETIEGGRFWSNPYEDSRDRLSLLTVLADLRPVAALGFGDEKISLPKLKDILVNHGLKAVTTDGIFVPTSELVGDIPSEIAKVNDNLHQKSPRSDENKILWVFSNAEVRGKIKEVLDGTLNAGILLCYPECCVRNERQNQARVLRAFLTAIIAAVGEDPRAVERALRQNLKVNIPDDVMDCSSVPRTIQRFPFIFHIACNECLASDTSASAALNQSYEALAYNTDPALHKRILNSVKEAKGNSETRDQRESKLHPS
jgi:hypothetical protein